MITISETRYLTTLPSIITLQDEDNIFYYVHKSLYDQAVILEDRYGDAIGALQEAIGGNSDLIAISKFIQYVPEPLKILGHFLALMDSDIEDFTDIIGAMDIIASSVNLRNLIKQPRAIRAIVKFDMRFGNTYKDSWDHFFSTCYAYDDVVGVRKSGSKYEEDDEYEDDSEAMAQANMSALAAMAELDALSPVKSDVRSDETAKTEENPKDGLEYLKQRRAALV